MHDIFVREEFAYKSHVLHFALNQYLIYTLICTSKYIQFITSTFELSIANKIVKWTTTE